VEPQAAWGGGRFVSERLETALRWAASAHAAQTRKGTDVPYVQHPAAVALILERAGWPEPVVIAGLLHDLVEDTEVTLDDLRATFGGEIAEYVARCTERKRDDQGRPRPWADRKREWIESVAAGPVEVRAIALADKLHNLASLAYDLKRGAHDWSRFRAGRNEQLAYHAELIDRFGTGDARLEALADAARALLESVRTASAPASSGDPRPDH